MLAIAILGYCDYHYSLNQAGDWIWNKKKSRRWNQDMQRESGECIVALEKSS